jgi:PKHD-type hydroxylase
MLVHITGLINQDDALRHLERLKAAAWGDGRATAGPQSARAKHNQQLAEDDPLSRDLGAKIVATLERNTLFMSAALPLKVFPPLFNKYEAGESFGTHVDNAIRQVAGTPHRVRTDLSATLFFSPADEYEGGELVIEDTYGLHSVKLGAGDLVLYPSSSLHHVRPVTQGARICSFFWIQSMVRDDPKRMLLFDLDVAVQRISSDMPEHASLVSLTGVYHNLIRQWAEV